jgi:hypothetical protein
VEKRSLRCYTNQSRCAGHRRLEVRFDVIAKDSGEQLKEAE